MGNFDPLKSRVSEARLLSDGMQELLALRWSVVDLDAKVVTITEALEGTKEHGLRFKGPKTRSGRRQITLPDVVVDALRDHKRQQLEQRMVLGLGKLPDDALVFPTLSGGPQSPDAFSAEWRAQMCSLRSLREYSQVFDSPKVEGWPSGLRQRS